MRNAPPPRIRARQERTASRRPVRLASAAVIVAVLAGCTSVDRSVDASSASPSSSAPPSISASPSTPVDPALVPLYPPDWTADAAATETTRIGGAIVSLIDPSAVVNDDAHAEAVPAAGEASGYFGILHTVTLDPATDAAAQVEFMVERLTASGWSGRDASDQGGVTLVALVSRRNPAQAWFVVVGADQSVPGQSVITVQLASPALP